MNIAINVRLLRKDNMSGIGVFTFETLKRVVAKHPEHKFIYIFDEDFNKEFITSDNIETIIVRPRGYHRAPILWFWHEIMLSHRLKRLKPDLFIAPDGFMSLSSKIPTLIVIHDLNFEHFPTFIPKALSNFHRKFTPKYARKAIRVMTVSEFSKNDIADRYNISKEKIDVVYNGSKDIFKPLSEDEKRKVKDLYSEGSPYFLFVGSIHPRKNLYNQLKAYELFRINNKSSYHKFLIVGEKWIWDQKHQDLLERMLYKSDVIFTSRINDYELTRVVASADCMLYVSSFEGFGIPILEAFSCAVPVITSTTSSMPEVAADAALCVDPKSDVEIAKAMHKVIYDADLKTSLIEKGFERLKIFNWERTANLFWESIEKAAEELKIK